MKHLTLPRFWNLYRQLPKEIQKLADKNYQLLKVNPSHPSLQLKKVGRNKQLWSVRVGISYRALGTEKPQTSFGFGLELTPNMTDCFHNPRFSICNLPDTSDSRLFPNNLRKPRILADKIPNRKTFCPFFIRRI